MRRRDVIQLLAGASIAAPYRVAAQTAKTYRLATFTATPAIPEDSPLGKLLTEAMAQRGYHSVKTWKLRPTVRMRSLPGCRNLLGILLRASSMPWWSSVGRRPTR
jgi:hypothetical protein